MMAKTGIKFIGACCKYGQKKPGVDIGPKYVKKYLPNLNFTYISELNGEFDYLKLYKEHNESLKKNKVVTIGGDHSISLATCASSIKKYKDDLTIIWVDAHADINTRISSLSKNLHGMPVASLIGTDNIFNLPQINPNKIIYIGLRDLDQYEVNILKDLNIKNYDMNFIRNNGINKIIDEIKNTNNLNKIHLSFDVDVLDPCIFPSTGTPVENGISLYDAYMILGNFREKLVSVDFVEFNPELSDLKERNNDARKLGNMIKFII